MVDLHKWEDDGGRVRPDEHADELDQRARVCLERHGFYMRPGPGERFWVFIPAGHDHDGAPLTRAWPCWPEEARAWREGRFNDIAVGLAQRGHPVRLDSGRETRPTGGGIVAGLRRLARAIRRRLWRATT